MKFEFNVGPFFRSHGTNPKGRGSWAFVVEGGEEILFSPSMTYAEAKAWVRAKARLLAPPGYTGNVNIDVLP